MELYHLDWSKSVDADRDRHFLITLGFDETDEARGHYAEALAEGLYEHVADVEGDDLDFLYAATNNGVVSDSWSRKPPEGVKPIEPSYHLGEDGTRYGRRSTSVGDLIVANGRLHAVAKLGFHDLGPDPRPSALPKA